MDSIKFIASACQYCDKDIEVTSRGTVRMCRGCYRIILYVQDIYRDKPKDDRTIITKILDIITSEKINNGVKFKTFLTEKLDGALDDKNRAKKIVQSI